MLGKPGLVPMASPLSPAQVALCYQPSEQLLYPACASSQPLLTHLMESCYPQGCFP